MREIKGHSQIKLFFSGKNIIGHGRGEGEGELSYTGNLIIYLYLFCYSGLK